MPRQAKTEPSRMQGQGRRGQQAAWHQIQEISGPSWGRQSVRFASQRSSIIIHLGDLSVAGRHRAHTTGKISQAAAGSGSLSEGQTSVTGRPLQQLHLTGVRKPTYSAGRESTCHIWLIGTQSQKRPSPGSCPFSVGRNPRAFEQMQSWMLQNPPQQPNSRSKSQCQG